MQFENFDQLHEQTLVGRVAWLIRLRWFAITGVAIIVLLVDEILPIHLPIYAKVMMLGIVAVIGGYNYFLHRRLRHWSALVATDPDTVSERIRRLTYMQILADLICLTALLNLSGGLLNPLCVFMIFHCAIAGIILTRRETFGVAFWASLLLVGLGVSGAVVPVVRVPLSGFALEQIDPPLIQNGFYIFSVCFAFSSSFFLIAYFTADVSFQLREALDDLERANASLLHQDQMLSRFMRVAGHQLRSPVAAMIGLIKAHMSTIEFNALPAPMRDMFGRIERRCQSMMNLVDDFLRLTQVREGLDRQDEPVLIDLTHLVSESCQNFRPQIVEKGLELAVRLPSQPVVIRARERDLLDIIENLISNAIKYTDTGRITVEGKRIENHFELMISDTGIGIPPQDQPYIFKEFFRAGNAMKKNSHSSGLGLNIVHAIISRLAGQITFQSKVGEGTTFQVTLPLSR